MGIDLRSHTPVYIQLADLLREEIDSGALAPGSTLASEGRLAQEHGIGRESVRMAVALLRAEGLISTSRGRGSWVRERPQRSDVTLAPGGFAIARMPSSQERREMDLDEGVPVMEIHRPDGETQIVSADQARITRPENG
jgi:GntR family transcriptional regulator